MNLTEKPQAELKAEEAYEIAQAQRKLIVAHQIRDALVEINHHTRCGDLQCTLANNMCWAETRTYLESLGYDVSVNTSRTAHIVDWKKKVPAPVEEKVFLRPNPENSTFDQSIHEFIAMILIIGAVVTMAIACLT
jgi:hypothetical protein